MKPYPNVIQKNLKVDFFVDFTILGLNHKGEKNGQVITGSFFFLFAAYMITK